MDADHRAVAAQGFPGQFAVEGKQFGRAPVVPGRAADDVPIPRPDDAGRIEGRTQVLKRPTAIVIHLGGHGCSGLAPPDPMEPQVGGSVDVVEDHRGRMSVTELKERVERKRYTVDPRLVAEALLRREVERRLLLIRCGVRARASYADPRLHRS